MLYKTLTVWRKPFDGGDMKHSINGKWRLYYVCNWIEFEKVLVLLRILKHLSSWARSVMTHLLMRDSYALIQTKKKICARMPVYCVLFRSKFSTVSGFMINCLLTEFGWAGRENIWLSVIKQGPRCAPTTQSISTQYFGFVRHTFIAHCNWTWKMKSFILFLMGNVKLKCWVTVQPKFAYWF